ncbi:polymorphic toxin type 24 domain-containing protein [Nocardia sp. SYP-A9097]|uniref:polymorphic toxin type 24 domain-containing protein n=1 Tax=Nocardia sp. SYP-A9097 TaxID=2663237 RepID=UPI001891E550|nr:polymorphic toxin type 24 domain-containing protein [Nocardia sp. SYP-A9097]
MADCGAMAGVDETGAAWGRKYDLRAAEVLTMVSDLGNGLQKLGNVIVRAGYNHYLADYDSILDSTVPPAAMPASPTPACLYYGSTPAAGGPSNGLREAADSLIRLADKVGIDIPDGNTDKLQTAADAWTRLQTAHTAELASVLKNAAAVMNRNDVEDAHEFTRRLLDLQAAIDDILNACGELAQLCTSQKSDLDHLRGELLHGILVELSWAVAGELTIAIASAWFTFGITAVVMTGATAATVTRYALRITEAVRGWRDAIATARARFALRDLSRSRRSVDEANRLQLEGVKPSAQPKPLVAQLSLREELDAAATWPRGNLPTQGGPPNGYLAKRDPQGNITHYSYYDADGVATKRVDLTGKAHLDKATGQYIPPPHVVDVQRNVNPATGEIFGHPPQQCQTCSPRGDSIVRDNSKDAGLQVALDSSRSPDAMIRLAEIPKLGAYIEYPEARMRLQELMDDDIVTVEVDAAEVLIRVGGQSGLLAVLEVLGRREDDPDVDYIAYMLQNLDSGGELPVLAIASSIENEKFSDMARVGLANLRQLIGR